jgi:PPOX class probable F420-dependent enzyme
MQDRQDQPPSRRPHMPGYGLPDASSRAGLLPWTWARERLEAAHTYWIATVRPDGRPHLMPVWGVWDDDHLYFSTAAGSRKARNLVADPRLSISIEQADESVVVEGTAGHVTDPAEPVAVRALYTRKYGMAPPDDPGSPLFVMEPEVAFGFSETEFASRATRWDLRP